MGTGTASTTLKKRSGCGAAATAGSTGAIVSSPPGHGSVPAPASASATMHASGRHTRCGSPPAWALVWSMLDHLGLNRQHRLTAWRLLHGAIWCGAFRGFIGHCRQQLSLAEASVQAASSLSGSARDADTPHHRLPFISMGLDLALSHLDAPQWQPGASSVSGFAHGRRPASMVSEADQRLLPSWTQPRIATVGALHSARTQRKQSTPTTATSVAVRVVHQMRAARLEDWQRGRSMDSLASLIHSVCCSHWLRGRQQFIAFGGFSAARGLSQGPCTKSQGLMQHHS